MAQNEAYDPQELRRRIDRLVRELAEQDRELAEARSGNAVDEEEVCALRADIASAVASVRARRARAAALPPGPVHAFAVRA